eukprot:TRINITY_DN12603_c0_g1_i1.p1 TRINITY_DN12603_c0_g1~~TRINITY_DN12603_c0_g1_i1.p1  ORF type:complete len:221 (-),score=45.27 TRINITY_DN12603_c0_g1_i1:140-802(-)
MDDMLAELPIDDQASRDRAGQPSPTMFDGLSSPSQLRLQTMTPISKQIAELCMEMDSCMNSVSDWDLPRGSGKGRTGAGCIQRGQAADPPAPAPAAEVPTRAAAGDASDAAGITTSTGLGSDRRNITPVSAEEVDRMLQEFDVRHGTPTPAAPVPVGAQKSPSKGVNAGYASLGSPCTKGETPQNGEHDLKSSRPEDSFDNIDQLLSECDDVSLSSGLRS